MNYLKLSWKNIIANPLSSILSITLFGLGVCLISLMLLVSKQLENTLNKNIKGIDMVLGAKGSPLQLILSAVFQIDSPTGNIAMEQANRVAKSPLVKLVIPLSFGDSYQGFRMVGSTHQYPELYQAQLQKGGLWQDIFEVTAGAEVAKKLGLKIGDSFQSQHGFDQEGDSHQEHHYKIVGILAPTNTVLDQLLLTDGESIWASHHPNDIDEEHEVEGPHHHEEKAKEITAMLVQFKGPVGKLQVPRFINEKTNMQSAVPSFEVYRLLDLMGVGINLLNGLAICILIVSGLSVFINLYNALRERKYEMALLRNYGASRWRLVQVLVQESITLAIAGYVFGLLLSRIGLWFFGQMMSENYGYTTYLGDFMPEEAALFIISILIGVFATLIPAIRAYTIQIARTLSDD